MGNSASQTNARSLRESLVGLHRFAQHTAAYEWAVANGRVIDLFGAFAKERHLLLMLKITQPARYCGRPLRT